MAYIDKHNYICKDVRIKRGYPSEKRNYFDIIGSDSAKRYGKANVNAVMFPAELIGRKVRFKMEIVQEKKDYEKKHYFITPQKGWLEFMNTDIAYLDPEVPIKSEKPLSPLQADNLVRQVQPSPAEPIVMGKTESDQNVPEQNNVEVLQEKEETIVIVDEKKAIKPQVFDTNPYGETE